MQNILEALFAMILALSNATGTPAETRGLPNRSTLAQPAPVTVPSATTSTVAPTTTNNNTQNSRSVVAPQRTNEIRWGVNSSVDDAGEYSLQKTDSDDSRSSADATRGKSERGKDQDHGSKEKSGISNEHTEGKPHESAKHDGSEHKGREGNDKNGNSKDGHSGKSGEENHE